MAGYLWDKKAIPLLDAPSQALGLCLKWRRNGEPLTASKLRILHSLWARQVRSPTQRWRALITSAPQIMPQEGLETEEPAESTLARVTLRHSWLAVLTLREALAAWDEAQRAKQPNEVPQQARARARMIQELVENMQARVLGCAGRAGAAAGGGTAAAAAAAAAAGRAPELLGNVWWRARSRRFLRFLEGHTALAQVRGALTAL
jgi:hypothetical protein